MRKERLAKFNEEYRKLTPSAQSRDTYNLTEIGAILNMSERSAFILSFWRHWLEQSAATSTTWGCVRACWKP
jgi:hypothetical protein